MLAKNRRRMIVIMVALLMFIPVMNISPVSAGHRADNTIKLYLHDSWLLSPTPPAGDDKEIECKTSQNPLNLTFMEVGQWKYSVPDEMANISGELNYEFYIIYKGQGTIVRPLQFRFTLLHNGLEIQQWGFMVSPPITPNSYIKLAGMTYINETTLRKSDSLSLLVEAKVPRSNIFFVYGGKHPASIEMGYEVIDVPPSVYISTDVSSPLTYVPVNVTIYGYDPDSSVVRYDVDFEGDGIWDYTTNTTSSQITITHYWEHSGDYLLTARIWDEDGKYGIGTYNVHVRNRPPVAIPDENEIHGYLNQNIRFNGTGADRDGTIKYYRWDFDNDGIWDFESSTSAEAYHSFDKLGTYTVVFQVEDDSGGLGNATVSVIIEKNRPPVARIISISPQHPYRFDKVTFKGEGTDYDGTVVAYEWYSSIDGFLSDKPEFFTRNLSIGHHIIRFRVMDNSSEWSDWVTTEVDVNEWSMPVRVTTTSYREYNPSLGYGNGYVMTYTREDSIQFTSSSYGFEWHSPVVVAQGGESSIVRFGDAYFTALDHNGKIYISYSQNGDYWSKPIEVASLDGILLESPSMRVIGDRIYMVYVARQDSNTSSIYLSWSTDGFSWSQGERITYDPSINTDPSIFRADNGRYYILFSSNRNGSFDIWLSSSADGENFNIPRVLISSAVNLRNASAVVDDGGNIWIFYDDSLW